jgi:hypothetical protein
MAKTFIAELVEGQPVTSFFLAKQIQVRQRRSGEPYLALVLADRTGELPAVMWEGVDESVRSLSDGDIVKVQAVLGAYHGEPQLTVTRARKATPEEVSPDDYLPRSERDPAAMLAALDGAVEEMGDPHLRQLLREIFADPATRALVSGAPAAKAIHHAVLGGLLEHTVSVVGLCRLLADYYPADYEEWLMAAAMLHDVGSFINRSGRHRHAYYIIANSEIYGFTTQQRRLVAAIARYVGRSKPSPQDRALRLLPMGDRQLLPRAVVLLRLARALNQGRKASVASVETKVRESSIEFRLKTRRTGAELEEWSLLKEKSYFREVFGRELVVVSS